MIFLFSTLFVIISIFLSIKFYLHFKKENWKRKHNKKFTVGFFHPYCNAGGGGERVLWAAIRAIQKKYEDAHCIVYSGDEVADQDIVRNVQVRFNIKLNKEVQIVYLKRRGVVEAKYYPYFTLLLQSVGSIVLGFEALFKHVPDIYIDTMGYAFTLPVFKFLGSCRVGVYVHFPTISTDMLKVVESRKVAVNNRRFISNSPFFSQLKLVYYKLFALLYGFMGRLSEVILVNSSWTRDHILELWTKPERTFRVYPPCDVSEFNAIPLERHKEQKAMRIISLAQFRPEKNHELQIRAFHNFLMRLGEVSNIPHLVLIGSCRHEEDYMRVEKLKDLCSELGLSEHVFLKVNLTFQDIIQEMTNSSVALHSMMNEHFGISIVECMSAGLIMIAHNSGGPKMDIVITEEKRTGFLATDIESFSDALENIYKMNYQDLHKIRQNARDSVSRFSDQKFEDTFLSAIKLLFI